MYSTENEKKERARLFHIDNRSRVPIHQQLQAQIVRYVSLGLLLPDQQLPSVRALAVEAGVNPGTVQKAFEQLSRDGIIYAVVGSGWYVGDNLEAAEAAVERSRADKTRQYFSDMENLGMTEAETKLAEEIPAFVKRYEDAMEDDLNTADAISVIFELVKFANTNVEAGVTSKAFAQKIYDTMKQLMDILGIDIKEQEVLLDEEIENLIEERQAARKAKNFARADEIRDLLTEKGIILEDTREGVRWKRA